MTVVTRMHLVVPADAITIVILTIFVNVQENQEMKAAGNPEMSLAESQKMSPVEKQRTNPAEKEISVLLISEIPAVVKKRTVNKKNCLMAKAFCIMQSAFLTNHKSDAKLYKIHICISEKINDAWRQLI